MTDKRPPIPDPGPFLTQLIRYREWLREETAANEERIRLLGGDNTGEQDAAPWTRAVMPRPSRANLVDSILAQARPGWLSIGQIIEALRDRGHPIEGERRIADAKVRIVLRRNAAKLGWETRKRQGTRQWTKTGVQPAAPEKGVLNGPP